VRKSLRNSAGRKCPLNGEKPGKGDWGKDGGMSSKKNTCMAENE